MDFKPTSKPKTEFIFPYSTKTEQKRVQVWSNLQSGILFEDTGTFVRWDLPFSEIDALAEQKNESADRTNWYLGKRTILDGHQIHIGVMKWEWIPETNPINEISQSLGYDFDGNERFLELIDQFTSLLGEPNNKELTKFGQFDLGCFVWENGAISISLVGVEIFNCRYSLTIGLKKKKAQPEHGA